ncbi:MHS family MFS transporter [Streptomyces sp. 4503]|uniref:MHS family MFS transporter n=1 Tax=Streptomyces niphimycinicus TaxID=2842201 RepID=A0ABS6CJV3_9ACTN|nr:MFS transporter [Streptomyces niphimycinicus]MBU3867221.1 MHS family MFS transporter [Streptomyces niphimycinicus]
MTPTDSRTSGSHQARRVAWAAFIGSTIEWYDFFLYATAAALVFNAQFFPSADPAVGSIAAFGTLAAGFVSRPLGGLVMGHFGDRYGRKNTLIASLLIMGLCTVAIGLIPTYSAIGVAAPILLTLMRVIQGIGLGGEWGGAVVLTLEHAPKNRRGLYGAAPQMGVPAGLIAANLAVLGLTRALGEDAFNSWGWRIPFLLSLLLIAVGMYLRLSIEESHAYSELAEPAVRQKLPVAEVLQEHWRSVLRACFVVVGNSSVAYVFMTYVLSYGKQTLHIDATFLLLSVIGGAVMWLVSAPLWGQLGDRWGLRRLFLVGGYIRVAWALAFLPVVDTGNKPLIFVFMLSMGLVLSMTHASVGVMTALMFPLKIRYTGSSAAYQIGSLLGGGITPLVAASLMKATGTSMSITLYILAVGLISLAATKGLSRDDVGEGVSAAEREPQPQKV